jgi:hypothetical protein
VLLQDSLECQKHGGKVGGGGFGRRGHWASIAPGDGTCGQETVPNLADSPVYFR